MEDFSLYDPTALLSVPPPPPVPTIDQAGRDLLVRTVIGEADGEPLPGQAGVAHVVLNRLKSGSFGKSLEDVLFAPKQFEPWGSRRDELMPIPTNDPRYQQAAAVVDGALAGKLPDPTKGSTHFANPEIVAQRGNSGAMRWINAMAENGSGIRIGKHAFGNPDAPAQPQAEQPAAQPAAARAPAPFFRQQTIPVRAGVDMEGISPGARGVFDSLTKLGIPGLEVVSGYRDPERNARAGGAKGSQHLHGNAIDINIANLTPEQRQQVLDAGIAAGARGIGIYPGGKALHLDVRETPAAWGANPSVRYSGVSDPNAYPEWARGGITRLFAGQGGAPVVQASAYVPVDRPRASQPTYEQRQALLGAVPLDANGFTPMRMPNVQNADVTQAEPMTLTGMLMSPERMLPGKAPLAAMPTIPGAIDPSFVYRDGPRPVERAPEPTARDMVARLGDRRGTQGRSLADRPAAGAGYAEGPTRMMPIEDYSNAGDGGIRADIASRAGGLGGLGGFVMPGTDTTATANPAAGAGGGGMDVGTVLQAVGMSLMSGDRRNPMKNFATIFNTLQTAANGQAKTAQEQYALASALKMSGMNDQQAKLFAVNPTAAKIAIDQMQVQQARGQEEAFGRGVAGIGASQPSVPTPDRVGPVTTQPPPFATGGAPAQPVEAPLPVPTQSGPAPVQTPGPGRAFAGSNGSATSSQARYRQQDGGHAVRKEGRPCAGI